MTSMRISVFCLSSELQDWIREIGGQYGLSALAYHGDRLQEYEIFDPGKVHFQSNWRRVFLLPKSQHIPDELAFNEISPAHWGWIDITPGGLVEKNGEMIVLMTDMSVTSLAGDVGRSTWKAAKALSRAIKEGARNDVRGRNLVTGGQSNYRNIWFTCGAEKAFRSGIKFRQNANFNVVFELAN